MIETSEKKQKNPLKHPDQRVGVFIDVQNIYHSVKNLYGMRVNFETLLKTVVSDRPLVRAVAYVAKSETAAGEDSFFEDFLWRMGRFT